MNASLLDRRDRWRLAVSSAGSGSGSYPGFHWSHTGQIRSFQSIDTEDETLAVKILVSSISTGDREATLEIPRWGITHTETVSGHGSIDAYVEVEGQAVHVFRIGDHPAWRISCDAVKFYVQGSLVGTWTPSATAQTLPELYFTPSSVIVVGGPPIIESETSFGTDPLPEFSNFDYSGSSSATATGGWSYEPAGHGPLIERPVSLMPLPDLDQTGYAFTLGGPTMASGSASGSIQASSYSYSRHTVSGVVPGGPPGSCYHEWESYDAAVNIFTVEERKLRRLGESYRALLQRFGMPWTKSLASIQQYTLPIIAGLIDNPVLVSEASAERELTPARSEMLRVVGQAEDTPLEEVLGFVPYAPVTLNHRKGNLSYTYQVLVFGTPPSEIFLAVRGDGTGTECVYSAGFKCQTRLENPAIPAFLNHRYDWVRAWNTIAHPFWQMFPHFPTNAATYWNPVEGVNVPAHDDLLADPPVIGYWNPVHSQYLTHPALPEAERRQTRNTLRTNLLGRGPFAFWWQDVAVGVPIPPVGICRFEVETPAIPISKPMTSASSSLWSGTDCALSHGTSVTVDPSASPCVVNVNLGSWTDELRMFPHLASRIKVGWNSSNVDSMLVELVGVDGSVITLATTPGTYDRPSGPTTKYCGSWAKDHSADTAVVDTGSDLEPNGISSATMSNLERSLAPQLLPGRTAAQLRFTITPTSTSSNVTIDYPEFHRSSKKYRAVPLDHQHSALLIERGPGLLIGTLDWWDREDNVDRGDTPGGSVWARRIMDVFSYQKLKNVLFLAEDADDNLAARLATIYDSVEGQAPIDAAYDTMAVPIGVQDGIKWILWNGFQIPPMAAFPHKKRDAVTLEYKSPIELTNEIWDWSEESRYYPCSAAISLQPASAVDFWTSLSSMSVDGWKIHYHQRQVDNTEAGDFVMVRGLDALDVASLSPWFGYFCIVEGAASGGVRIASCLQTGRIVAIEFGDGIRVVRYRPQPVGEYAILGLESTTILGADVTINTAGHTMIVFTDSGGTKLIESSGDEATWSAPVQIDVDGENCAIAANPRGKEVAISSYHSGAWHLYLRTDRSQAFQLVGTIATVANPVSAGLAWQPSGSNMLLFAYSDGSETRFLRSGNLGQNWELA